MPDPISFTTASPRHRLPLLFAGQAQKEFYVNEAFARIDALLHAAIEGTADDPPASPAEGECWLVGPAPSGSWLGHAGELACLVADSWIFAAARDGMRLLDVSSGQMLLYRGGWSAANAPIPPSGGATVDAEARAAIVELIDALADAGITPAA